MRDGARTGGVCGPVVMVIVATAWTGTSDTTPHDATVQDAPAADTAPLGTDAGTDAGALLAPQIDGDWWTVAHVPDLGSLNRPGHQPVDFAIWPAPEGTWQIWSCIRYTACPGESRLFYHWEGASITATDWTPMGIAMQSDPSVGEPACGLQAPYVLPAAGRFHMFYGDWEAIAQQEGTDGKSFTRDLNDAGTSEMFVESSVDANTRDPMVLGANGMYYIYYTAHPGGLGAVYARTSHDLRTWSDSQVVAFGGVAGTGPYASECPHVVYRGDTGFYYLFRTQQYVGTQQTTVYRSRNPLDFGVNDDRYRIETLPVAAPEIVQVGDQTYIAALNPGLDGIRIARLRWAPLP